MKTGTIAILFGLGLLTGTGLSGCETMSEDACRAGSWEDVGFKDGEAGRSRARLADIAESCAEYGVAPDRFAYLRGFEAGVIRYCRPDRGYDDGIDGRSAHAECQAGGFGGYLSAFDDGNAVFQRIQERDDLVERWEDRRTALRSVEARLDGDALDAKTRRRLERKAIRLENEMDDLRIDIRALERLYDLPA